MKMLLQQNEAARSAHCQLITGQIKPTDKQTVLILFLSGLSTDTDCDESCDLRRLNSPDR